MDYRERAQLLKEQDITVEMVANALSVTPQAIYQTLNDGRSSRRIANAIAELCDQPLTAMFPYYQQKDEKEAMQQKVNKLLAKFA